QSWGVGNLYVHQWAEGGAGRSTAPRECALAAELRRGGAEHQAPKRHHSLKSANRGTDHRARHAGHGRRRKSLALGPPWQGASGDLGREFGPWLLTHLAPSRVGNPCSLLPALLSLEAEERAEARNLHLNGEAEARIGPPEAHVEPWTARELAT